MHSLSPDTSVWAIEPDLFDDTLKSLKTGERVANPKGQKTICDAIMTPTPNALTFSINKRLLAGGLSVSDDAVCNAMKFAYEHFKIVIEPGGAVGLAAVLANKLPTEGKTLAVIITGGNIEANRFASLLHRADTNQRTT